MLSMIAGPNTPKKMRNRKHYKLDELMDFEVDKSNIVGSKGSFIEESTQMQAGMRIFSTSWKDTTHWQEMGITPDATWIQQNGLLATKCK